MTKMDMAEEIMRLLMSCPGIGAAYRCKVQDLLDRLLAPESGQDTPFPSGAATVISQHDVWLAVKPILAAGGRIIIEPATEAQP